MATSTIDKTIDKMVGFTEKIREPVLYILSGAFMKPFKNKDCTAYGTVTVTNNIGGSGERQAYFENWFPEEMTRVNVLIY